MPRVSPIKTDYEKDVVYLYQFPRMQATPCVSPFCFKIETWFRMAGIKYENVEDLDPRLRSLEGTLPFVELNGKEYDDSNLIMQNLFTVCQVEETEEHLTDEQKGAVRGLEQMLEHCTFLVIMHNVYSKHYDRVFSAEVFGHRFLNKLPGPLVFFIRKFKPRQWLGAMKTIGIGKHSDEEISKIGKADVLAVSQYLGSKTYLTGDTPIRADATAFAILALLLYVPIPNPINDFIKSDCPNLIAYSDNIKAKFWPDWTETIETGDMNLWNKK